MKTFKLFNFNLRSSAKVQAEGCTKFLSSLCLILTMLFTLGVGQMWATVTIYAVGNMQDNGGTWRDEKTTLYCHNWGSSGTTWPGTSMTKWNDVSVDGHQVFKCDLKADGNTKCIFNTNGGWQTSDITNLDATVKAYPYPTYLNGTWYYSPRVCKALWESDQHAYGGRVYFDNSSANWSSTYMYLVIGHGSYVGYYRLTKLGNTKLYYVDLGSQSWGDSKYVAIVGHTASKSTGSGNPNNLAALSKFSDVAQYSFEYESTYMVSMSSETNCTPISIDYESSGYSAFNFSQTVEKYTSTDGGSSYSKTSINSGTVTITPYKLTGNGTVSNSDNTGTLDEASDTSVSKDAVYTGEVTLTASANTGFDFVGWFDVASGGSALSTNTSYTYNAPNSTKTIYARFKKKQYTVSYGVNSSTRYGSITLNSGSAVTTTSSSTLNHGTVISFTASANSGYQVEGWYSTSACAVGDRLQEGGTSYNAGTLTAEKTVYVKFKVRTGGTITLSAGANGEVSADNSSWGTTKTISNITTATDKNIYARGNTGYQFSSWTISSGSGTIKTNAASGVFTTVAYEDATVTASFSEIMRTITISGGVVYGGSATSTTAGVATSAKITANAPAAGKKFTGWTLGTGVSLKGGYSLTDRTIEIYSTANATVTANYADRAQVKMYFAKPTARDWSTARAYAWKSSDASVQNAAYPGVTLSTTEEINGITYYVYQYYTEADGIGGAATGNSAWNKIVFNDDNDARKTGDLTIADGHYYYFNSSSSGETTPYAYEWYLKGTMNSWSESNPISINTSTHTGSVSVSLTKDVQYELKLYNKVDDYMWSNNTALGNVRASVAATQLYSSDPNSIYMTPSITGAYKFTITQSNTTTPHIAIDYPNQYVNGSWNNQDTPFDGDGCVEVELGTGTYTFKIKFNNETYGCDANMTSSSYDYYFYTNVSKPCTLTVATAGKYKIGWNGISKSASVVFPADQAKATFTPNRYIYFDARTENDWHTDNPAAKFWFKNALTGMDIDAPICLKANALETWVYYAEVPDNDYVGRVQINRAANDGTHWNHSIIEHAHDRSNANQNCLVTPASGWDDIDLTWSTYAPPLSALLLSNNSTTTYGGSGTKANPYIVNVGDQVKVRASGTKAVNDDNMTIYYTFKDNATTIGSEGSSATCNYSTGAENAVHKMTVTARNRLLETSTYGTVKTTSDTVYYTRRVVYTGLTVSKSPAAGSATAPTISSTWAIKGNNVTVTAYAPATGYRFTGWTSSNGSFASASSLSTTFTPTAANAVAVANYELINYTITHSASTNGSYTIKVGSASAVSTNTTATYGQTITLAATPSNATFYKFDEWTVTGATPASTTSANTTFTMPAGNVTVATSFVQVNLAEGKTVVAGYEPDNANEHSDKITDGRTDNDAWVTWVNQDAADEWFYVDLGAFYQLNNLEVVWGADYSTDYIIQARQNAPASSAEAADDKCWFTLAEVTDATANSTKSTSVSAPARYVRLHSLSRSSNCIRVKEFRVFGTATATAYTTPTLSTAEVDNYPSNYEDVVLHLVGTDSKSTAIHTYKITDESSNVSIVTTDGDNLVTISGLSKFEHHTLTVQAMDPGALLSASQNVAVLIWDPTYNMAQGKTIVAGYEPGNADEHSEYAVDGSTSTGWTTYDKQPESVEWFYVDLGAYYQLSRIELVWGEVYSTDYVLEVRQDVPATSAIAADDNLWFPVAEVKDATASSTKSTAVDVRARYVRFHSLSRSAGFLRLYEFRVFTTRFADADTNVPVITTATASYNDDGKAYLNLTATDVEDGTTKWFYLYNPATSSYSLQQTNGSNQIIIDGLTECENYTFQVQAMDTAAKLSVVSNIAVRVPIISTTNLARGKTATAGTTQGGFVAANAVDGNTGTMWSGNYDRKDNENQWISIDLADKYSIDSIKITWGGDDGTWPQDYELQVSYDGSDYQPIGHYTTKPANQNCKYTFTNVSARYVRVWATKAGSTYGMEICEMAVHGDCYDDTELPIMLFAEAEEHNVYVSAADIYVGAIHKSIASDNLLYHVEYSSTGGDSGSRTISPANITNGAFSLDELRDGDTYTVNIWAAKTSDISSNRSANYRTVSFTTLELGGYTQYYFPGSMNGWLGVNNPAGWSPDPVEWRFKTTAINGIYKLSHSVSTTQDWVACFVYDKNNSIRTANDHTISVTKDNDFIITMKGLESYISNSHTIYIAGDAVGTAVDAEDAAHALTWTDGTHASWEGYVTSGETFKLIFHDQGAAGNKRTNVLTPSAVTYDGSAHYAKITFDLDTWEYEWSATDVSTYIYDDNSGDGKWSTTSNWLSGALPTIEKDVIITKPVTVDITTARAKSVIIDKSGDNSGQLVLDAGKELVVATTVRKTTDGSSYTATGENDIVFNSTSGAGLGALAIGSHATANGLNNATVNFSTLSNGSTANETAASASDAQYVGTPFSNRPAMLYQFYNSWMYKFINTGVPGWTRVDGEDGLDAFQGYCIFSADGTNHVYWMQGTLVASEDQSINLQYNGGDGSNANNENMLANSWMAPIKIAAFQASDFTNADATIYIYNTGSPDDYKNNSGASTIGTSAGQYTTYTLGTAGSAIIPSMQAFSVYTHGSTPSISLDYSKIVYDPAVAGSVVPGGNRAPQRTETDEPEKMRLYIGAESGYGDMLYMLEREDFAEGFENGWDGRKMFGEDVAPQLYAFTPDGNMAINCIPTFEGQLLGFRKGAQDNTYIFTFEYDGDNMWYLNDLKEQTSTLISAFDSYTFTSEADDTEARFIISRSPIHSTPTAVESATGAQQPAIRKIVINDHVFIIRNGLMYDVTGIMVR